MPNEEAAAALEALEEVLIVIVEKAHEIAVASAPDADARQERISELRRIGADIAMLSDACAVLVRLAHPWP